MCRLSGTPRAVLHVLLLAASAHVLDAESNGVRVADTSNMGRVLVATRDFSAGEVVLREQPVLVWGRGDFISMVKSFLAADAREQFVVNDMYCPDASPDGLELASQMLASTYSLTPNQILKLIKTAAANCIAYPDEGEILPGFAFSSNLHSSSALFEFGSKLAHACSPNARAEIFPASPEDERRSVGFRALRPIKDGELISFSYSNFALGGGGALSAADILVTPTKQRREILDKRGFFCHCDRCDGPDWCRPLKCCTKGCAEYALLSGSSGAWACPKCGALPASEMQAALRFEERMDDKWGRVHNASQAPAERGSLQPADIERLVQECAQFLGPTHCVVLKLLSTLARLCADTTLLIESLDRGARPLQPSAPDPRLHFTAAELRALSARTLMLKATRLECVAEGCASGAACASRQHAPQFFCCQEAEWAGEAVMKLPAHHRDSDVLRFVERYVDVMRLSIPTASGGVRADDDARRARFLALQAMLAETHNSTAATNNNTGTAPDGFVAQVAAKGLKLGTQVWIDGLRSAPQHNGHKATVVELDVQAARIQVRVRAGREPKPQVLQLRLKLENLSLTAPQPRKKPLQRRKHRRG